MIRYYSYNSQNRDNWVSTVVYLKNWEQQAKHKNEKQARRSIRMRRNKWILWMNFDSRTQPLVYVSWIPGRSIIIAANAGRFIIRLGWIQDTPARITVAMDIIYLRKSWHLDGGKQHSRPRKECNKQRPQTVGCSSARAFQIESEAHLITQGSLQEVLFSIRSFRLPLRRSKGLKQNPKHLFRHFLY